MNNIPNFRRTLAVLFLSLAVLLNFVGCGASSDPALSSASASVSLSSLEITNGEREILRVGDAYQLETNVPVPLWDELEWSASNACVAVDGNGKVTAVSAGKVTITVRCGKLSDSVLIEIVGADLAIPGTTSGTTSATTPTTTPTTTKSEAKRS